MLSSFDVRLLSSGRPPFQDRNMQRQSGRHVDTERRKTDGSIEAKVRARTRRRNRSVGRYSCATVGFLRRMPTTSVMSAGVPWGVSRAAAIDA